MQAEPSKPLVPTTPEEMGRLWMQAGVELRLPGTPLLDRLARRRRVARRGARFALHALVWLAHVALAWALIPIGLTLTGGIPLKNNSEVGWYIVLSFWFTRWAILACGAMAAGFLVLCPGPLVRKLPALLAATVTPALCGLTAAYLAHTWFPVAGQSVPALAIGMVLGAAVPLAIGLWRGRVRARRQAAPAD